MTPAARETLIRTLVRQRNQIEAARTSMRVALHTIDRALADVEAELETVRAEMRGAA